MSREFKVVMGVLLVAGLVGLLFGCTPEELPKPPHKCPLPDTVQVVVRDTVEVLEIQVHTVEKPMPYQIVFIDATGKRVP